MSIKYYFEDLYVGRVFESGKRQVTRNEIIAFAREYDPQAYHLGEERPIASLHEDVIASGWHVGLVCMRLLVDTLLKESSCLLSPGLDYLHWPKPLKSRDEVMMRAKVIEARPSQRKPEIGVTKWVIELENQHQEVVLAMAPTILFACKHSD